MGAQIEESSEKLTEAERRVQATKDNVFRSQVLSGLDLKMDEFRNSYGTKHSAEEAQRLFMESSRDWLEQTLAGTQDERVREIIRAQAQERIAHGAILTRAKVTSDNINQTDAMVEDEVVQNAKLGTQEGLATAMSLIRQAESSQIWSPEKINRYKALAPNVAISQAFARRLEADPKVALKEVSEKRGIFANADDEQRYQMIAAAEKKIKQAEADAEKKMDEANDANTSFLISQMEKIDAKGFPVMTRSDALRYAEGLPSKNLNQIISEANRVQDERDAVYFQKAFDLSSQGDISKGIRYMRENGPEGTQAVSAKALLQFQTTANNIAKLNEERTDPAVERRLIIDIASPKPRFTPMDIATMPGLSMDDRKSYVIMRIQKDEAQKNRNLATEEHERNVVISEIHSIVSSVDPLNEAMKAKAARLFSEYSIAANANAGTNQESYDRGLRIRKWWGENQPRLRESLGRDYENDYRVSMDQLPPDIVTRDDIAARELRGLYDGPAGQRELLRHLDLLDRAEKAKAGAAAQGVLVKIVREREQQKQAATIPQSAPQTPSSDLSNLGAFAP